VPNGRPNERVLPEWSLDQHPQADRYTEDQGACRRVGQWRRGKPVPVEGDSGGHEQDAMPVCVTVHAIDDLDEVAAVISRCEKG
jgi:hypothetical protein